VIMLLDLPPKISNFLSGVITGCMRHKWPGLETLGCAKAKLRREINTVDRLNEADANTSLTPPGRYVNPSNNDYSLFPGGCSIHNPIRMCDGVA